MNRYKNHLKTFWTLYLAMATFGFLGALTVYAQEVIGEPKSFAEEVDRFDGSLAQVPLVYLPLSHPTHTISNIWIEGKQWEVYLDGGKANPAETHFKLGKDQVVATPKNIVLANTRSGDCIKKTVHQFSQVLSANQSSAIQRVVFEFHDVSADARIESSGSAPSFPQVKAGSPGTVRVIFGVNGHGKCVSNEDQVIASHIQNQAMIEQYQSLMAQTPSLGALSRRMSVVEGQKAQAVASEVTASPEDTSLANVKAE